LKQEIFNSSLKFQVISELITRYSTSGEFLATMVRQYQIDPEEFLEGFFQKQMA
jgi:hypothetical protein